MFKLLRNLFKAIGKSLCSLAQGSHVGDVFYVRALTPDLRMLPRGLGTGLLLLVSMISTAPAALCCCLVLWACSAS